MKYFSVPHWLPLSQVNLGSAETLSHGFSQEKSILADSMTWPVRPSAQ